jgi:hypothetical protein
MNKLQQAAATYMDCGFNPLPLTQKKTPMLASGHTYLYEKHDDLKVFERAESIGLACGAVSDYLFCIDFDQKNGNDVQSVFYKFTDSKVFQSVAEHCAMYKTPSGGYHLIFKTDHSIPTKTHAKFQDGSVMIETRGEGAYIACEPSNGYQRIYDIGITQIKPIEAHHVNNLLRLAISFTEDIKTQHDTKEKHKRIDSWDINKPDGKYNEEYADEAKEILIKNGWQYVETRRDGIEYWTRPGKDINDGHSATWGKWRNTFFVFSDGCADLPSGHGYNPFNILTIYEHGGDWRKAKDALCERFGMVKHATITDEQKSAIDFPIDIFPIDIQEYIVSHKNAMNYNADFVSIGIISAISIVVGNKLKLKVKNGWNAPLIFWFAIVGDRGTMKSHPIAGTLKPIKEIDKKNYDLYINQLNDYNNLQEKEKKNEYKPEYKQIIVQDSTLEALHRVHRYNPRGIGLYKDELVGFINDMNKYRGGSDEQFWLESFNNKSLIINRATKDPMLLENTCINIIGTIQPDVLISLASKHTDNGLLDRFLYTRTERDIHVLSLDDVDDSITEYYNNVINEFNTYFNYYKSGDEYILTMTHEQMQIYRHYDQLIVDMQKSDEETYQLASYLSKARTYFPRFVLLCAVLNMIEGNELQINDNCIHNAWKITDYFTRSARDLFSETVTKNEIMEIKSTLKGKTTPEKIRELIRKGLNNTQIAHELGISKQYIGRIIGKK